VSYKTRKAKTPTRGLPTTIGRRRRTQLTRRTPGTWTWTTATRTTILSRLFIGCVVSVGKRSLAP